MLYTKAVPRIMPYAATLPPLDPTRPTVIGHTNGGPSDHGSLYGWFSRPNNTVCSHFQIMFDGTVEQYVPLDRQAFAQYAANAFAWSVEHQDDGDNTRPLTDAQLAAFATLVDDLGVPWVLSPETGGGVGWHELYPSWNKSGHHCAGPVRDAQFQALITQGGFDVGLSDDDKKWIVAQIRAAMVTTITHIRDDQVNGVAAVKAELDVIKAKLGA